LIEGDHDIFEFVEMMVLGWRGHGVRNHLTRRIGIFNLVLLNNMQQQRRIRCEIDWRKDIRRGAYVSAK
jgi:hypothetical protein